MTKDLTFYIVFHSALYPENTEGFSTQEIQDTFVWVGVNSRIRKTTPLKMINYPFIYEYKMRLYNPMFQNNYYYQNSVFFHLYKNPQYLQSKFIGFAQYDMKIERQSIPTKLMDDYVYGYIPHTSDAIWNFYDLEFWKTCFLDEYNKFYGYAHTMDNICKQSLFFYHTFIIPTSFFLHIMPFVEYETSVILKKLDNNTSHIAGTLERVFALCIACGLTEGRLKGSVIQGGIIHKQKEQRTSDSFREIIKGVTT
jgi:hypothetical protein